MESKERIRNAEVIPSPIGFTMTDLFMKDRKKILFKNR